MNKKDTARIKRIRKWIEEGTSELSVEIMIKILEEYPLEAWNLQTATLLPITGIFDGETSIQLEFNERTLRRWRNDYE